MIFIKNLKLFYIDDKYIEYLRKFDDKVAYNKNATRPYIGVIYTYNNIDYFAPLNRVRKGHVFPEIRNRCCNFELLEIKCKEWIVRERKN